MSDRPELEIFSITFAEGGMVIDYALTADIRMEGKAVRMSTLQLSSEHPDYRDDLALLRTQAQKTLRNALNDFDESPAFVPSTPVDDDDADGMGNPPRSVQ